VANSGALLTELLGQGLGKGGGGKQLGEGQINGTSEAFLQKFLPALRNVVQE